MRISRPCYDKYWRCPGWAGGGWTAAKVDRCNSGSLAKVINWHTRWQWHWHQCPTCRVWVLPYVTRLLDPTWLTWKLQKGRS